MVVLDLGSLPGATRSFTRDMAVTYGVDSRAGVEAVRRPLRGTAAERLHGSSGCRRRRRSRCSVRSRPSQAGVDGRCNLYLLSFANHRTRAARACRRRMSHRTNALRASSIHSTRLAAAMIDSNCPGAIG